MIHNAKKNQKSIHDAIHDLTTMLVGVLRNFPWSMELEYVLEK